MNVWIAAWTFSLLSSAGVYYFSRKAKVPSTLSLMLALAGFPAPLFQIYQSHASLIYTIDLVTPFAIISAYRHWRSSGPKLRVVAMLLVVAGSLLPFLIAALFSREAPDLLFTGMNLYRTIGAMSLMVRCNSLRRRDHSHFVNWLYAFSWIALVIALAMVAKFNGINSDVLDLADHGLTNELRSGSETTATVMGLFRASIGIFGVLAVCAYTANTKRALQSQLFSACGAIAGLSVCLFSGSKTSLLIGLVALAPKFLNFGAKQIAVIGLLILSLAIFLSSVNMDDARRVLPGSVVSLFDSGGEKRESMDVRFSIWTDCFDSVQYDPGIALGVARRESMPRATQYGLSPYWPGYFHNEYLSIFMLGGVWSALCYLAGVGLLFRLLLPRRSGSPVERFAILTFASGLVHGLTVVHLQTGLLFGATVTMVVATYGFGIPNRSVRAVSRGYRRVVVADQQNTINAIERENGRAYSDHSYHYQKPQGRAEARS